MNLSGWQARRWTPAGRWSSALLGTALAVTPGGLEGGEVPHCHQPAAGRDASPGRPVRPQPGLPPLSPQPVKEKTVTHYLL